MAGVGGKEHYPEMEDRVVRKWLDVVHSEIYDKVNRAKVVNKPCTWSRALEIYSPEVFQEWTDDKEAIMKRFNKQVYNRS